MEKINFPLAADPAPTATLVSEVTTLPEVFDAAN